MPRISNDYVAVEVMSLEEVSQDFILALITNLNNLDHLRFSRHRLTKHTLESSIDFLQKLRAMGGYYYQIVQVKDGLPVGTFTIKPLDESRCEAGILVFKEFSNRGIAGSIWRFLPGFIGELGFDFFVSGTHIQNIPMRRIMEKVDMELDYNRNYPNDRDADPKNIYFILQV